MNKSSSNLSRSNYRLVIPLMHCFDDNYAAPAAVAFLTLLENGAKDCFYKIYVLHTDITVQHQEMLQSIVARFHNASLEFVEPKIDIDVIWSSVSSKHHYSKEIIYKLIAADVFPQYNRMIIADVDVLYCNDVGILYELFLKDHVNFMYGNNARHYGLSMEWGDMFEKITYAKDFSIEERDALKHGVGAGFVFYNLALMRQENIPQKAIKYFIENAKRLKQPEQDVMNIVCCGRIGYMPIRGLVCSYLFDRLTEDEKPYWKEALESPIQLHYATSSKPWTELGSSMSHVWWKNLINTPFFYEVASKFDNRLFKSKYAFKTLPGLPFIEIWYRGMIEKVRFCGIFKLAKAEFLWRKWIRRNVK